MISQVEKIAVSLMVSRFIDKDLMETGSLCSSYAAAAYHVVACRTSNADPS